MENAVMSIPDRRAVRTQKLAECGSPPRGGMIGVLHALPLALALWAVIALAIWHWT